MKKILLATVALLVGGPALATDLKLPPVKAPVVVSPYAALNGFFFGFGVSSSGTNYDVLTNGIFGGVNANGTMIDLHGSYKFFDGTKYAAVTAGCGYDMTTNANAIGGVPPDHLFCTELVDLGGWLGSVVDISNNAMVPDFLKGAIPFASVGAAQRMHKNGRAAGMGLIVPIAQAPNWVAGARYLNIDYSSAQIDPLNVMKTENYVGIFLERKFSGF